jgi:hypothetical protein
MKGVFNMFDTLKVSKFHKYAVAIGAAIVVILTGLAVAFTGDDEKTETPAKEMAKMETDAKSAETNTAEKEEAVDMAEDATPVLEATKEAAETENKS